MTQLCIVSQQWDLPSNRFSLLLPLPQRSKAEVVIVSMSIVTAWHDLDDATEEKTTHLHGKACKQTKNFFQPLKPEEADLKSCTEEDNRASFTHKVKSRGFNKLCIISCRVTGFFQIKLLTKVFFSVANLATAADNKSSLLLLLVSRTFHFLCIWQQSTTTFTAKLIVQVLHSKSSRAGSRSKVFFKPPSLWPLLLMLPQLGKPQRYIMRACLFFSLLPSLLYTHLQPNLMGKHQTPHKMQSRQQR